MLGERARVSFRVMEVCGLFVFKSFCIYDLCCLIWGSFKFLVLVRSLILIVIFNRVFFCLICFSSYVALRNYAQNFCIRVFALHNVKIGVELKVELLN